MAGLIFRGGIHMCSQDLQVASSAVCLQGWHGRVKETG